MENRHPRVEKFRSIVFILNKSGVFSHPKEGPTVRRQHDVDSPQTNSSTN